MSEGELVEAAQNVRVPVATIASLCELTPTRIYQLSSQGVLPGIVDGLLPLAASLAAYIKYLRGFSEFESAGAGAVSTFASERTRLYRLRADAAELDKQARMGALARRSTRSSRRGRRTPTIFAPALGEEPSRSLFAGWWLQSFRRGCRLTSL
jgi:hypothetical protein